MVTHAIGPKSEIRENVGMIQLDNCDGGGAPMFKSPLRIPKETTLKPFHPGMSASCDANGESGVVFRVRTCKARLPMIATVVRLTHQAILRQIMQYAVMQLPMFTRLVRIGGRCSA